MRVKDALGRHGEDLAVQRLEAAGMVVLDRNWRCRERELPGEIDVIARDGRDLVVCEVKTRTGTGFSPLEAVTPDKQARLRRLGMAWLRQSGLRVDVVRFDVISIVRGRDGFTVDHVRGAF
ncbi:MAG TPA: YraN family protein [Mycobacteriales bacterium]|nr:YraN family protein [Mycobacteriales bacterium]